ncbi:enoyl-CoA hydratase/isomerase family protein [Aminobacter anthyllidis]|uniref:Enoyl-CoA hydratase/isomerase family protein n=1 Tax=Aminobacter anthyllidis TaxID=1035067 RepID=A0A9X1D8S2_9HYPH|nr:enoyl-CoA hydratase/isomerase family protein [Aminobacter anthyllidis]MBT1159481.1 enoyl-CoA hydratase/isomerase family protein [Aminobacter anthyllidis]
MPEITPDTTNYENILYEVDSEHICWVTLNRPEKANAMSEQLILELRAALLRADQDEDVNVIVVRGAGRGFSGGYDLDGDAQDDRSSIYPYRLKYIRQFEEFITPWLLSKPVIASVHKYAIGKAFEFSLFCDYTIATSDTKMGYSEVRYGLSAHCLFMPWLVNMKTAKDLLLTGREVPAHEAKVLGLISEVVEPADLHEATKRKATLMARIPREMQRMHKMYLNRLYELQGLRTATDYYLELVAVLGQQPVPEYVELTKMTVEKGLRAALDHAQARYKGLD